MTIPETPTAERETFDQIYVRLLTEAISKTVRWVVCGIIGISVFCVCLGVLGIVAVIKSVFL